jgi:hypothetical protein
MMNIVQLLMNLNPGMSAIVRKPTGVALIQPFEQDKREGVEPLQALSVCTTAPRQEFSSVTAGAT